MLEIIVVISIISVCIAITLVSTRQIRLRAKTVLKMNNQRLIVLAVLGYASDHDGLFPPSVATIGDSPGHWAWQQPTVITSRSTGNSRRARSVSSYIFPYIETPNIMFCPNAPNKYQYFKQAWQQGDSWNNPDTFQADDPVYGSFCFYWNYTAVLENSDTPFCGPSNSTVNMDESSLLVSDYFGYGHWRNKSIYRNHRAFGSCEQFEHSNITPGTAVSSDFWSIKTDRNSIENIKLKLHSGFVDGHIETYHPQNVSAIRVAMDPQGKRAYPDLLGPGIYYIPTVALPR